MAAASKSTVSRHEHQRENVGQLHYRDAVVALNSLQSNAETIRKSMQNRSKARKHNIPNMINYLHRVGITLDDIDDLSVIHVTGTKGKGSTCAFTESILRNYGYKTGLYSSPHLIEVRERIRINGKPVSRELFSNSFWHVFERLQASKDDGEGGMPHYFSFLTVLALYIFVREGVDVALLEVGIGGQYDSTNVVRQPVVCGVSSLDIDHTNLLGHTLQDIAWHKAGIFKWRRPAFTVPQPDCAMQVLLQRALEIQSPLSIAAPIEITSLGPQHSQLGIAGHKQLYNAGLAVQLCMTWIDARNKGSQVSAPTQVCTSVEELPVRQSGDLTHQMISGLSDCRWPGRNQIIYGQGVTYYLDGAHTPDSIQQCVDWFHEAAAAEEERLKQTGLTVKRALIFNITGDRPVAALLAKLQVCNFHRAAFCPNLAFTAVNDNTPDQLNLTVEQETTTKKSMKNLEIWRKLVGVAGSRDLVTLNTAAVELCHSHASNITSGETGPAGMTGPNGATVSVDGANWTREANSNSISELAPSGLTRPFVIDTVVNGVIDPSLSEVTEVDGSAFNFPCIASAMHWTSRSWYCRSSVHTQVLVTGSIHLVGGALELIAAHTNQ